MPLVYVFPESIKRERIGTPARKGATPYRLNTGTNTVAETVSRWHYSHDWALTNTYIATQYLVHCRAFKERNTIERSNTTTMYTYINVVLQQC